MVRQHVVDNGVKFGNVVVAACCGFMWVFDVEIAAPQFLFRARVSNSSYRAAMCRVIWFVTMRSSSVVNARGFHGEFLDVWFTLGARVLCTRGVWDFGLSGR